MFEVVKSPWMLSPECMVASDVAILSTSCSRTTNVQNVSYRSQVKAFDTYWDGQTFQVSTGMPWRSSTHHRGTPWRFCAKLGPLDKHQEWALPSCECGPCFSLLVGCATLSTFHRERALYTFWKSVLWLHTSGRKDQTGKVFLLHLATSVGRLLHFLYCYLAGTRQLQPCFNNCLINNVIVVLCWN